jgi:transcription elongation factor Elf1
MKKKDKKEYIKSPNHCPFCKGVDIFAGTLNIEDDIITYVVTCVICKKRWHDIYTVTDIKEIV